MAPGDSNPLPIGDPLPDWQPPVAPPHTVMTGRYVRLEPLDPQQHAVQLFEAYAEDIDRLSWTYMPYDPFETAADYRRWVQTHASGDDPQFYAIVDAGSQHALGVASYLRIKPASGTIEVGHIHYSPSLQATVMATEAMYLMAQRAFDLGYRRYEWKCDALNQASRRAALRLGFEFEGVFRQATVYKQRNRDTAWYAMLDRQWPRLQAGYRRWLTPDNFAADGRQRSRLNDLLGSGQTG